MCVWVGAGRGGWGVGLGVAVVGKQEKILISFVSAESTQRVIKINPEIPAGTLHIRRGQSGGAHYIDSSVRQIFWLAVSLFSL